MPPLDPPPPSAPIWERLDRKLPRRRPLSVPRIVDAAMTLADRAGLDALTIRDLAAELNSSPMGLYRYVATKDDIFELLVDAAYAEMVLPERASGNWRADLSVAASGIRSAVRAHPWLAALLGEGPHLGPHALGHREFCLAAVGGLGLDITTMMTAASMVTGYAMSFVQAESAEAELNRRSTSTEAQRREAAGPYIERVVLGSGRYPYLARWVTEGVDSDPDQLFDLGLQCVLDGIEQRLLRGDLKRSL